MIRVYDELVETGPVAVSEIDDRPSTNDKFRGVSTFKIRTGQGATSRVGGKTEDVMYIHGRHDEVDVLETWLSINSTAVEQSGEWAIQQKVAHLGSAWSDAAGEVIGANSGRDRGGSYDEIGPENCALCGEELRAQESLAEHLPDCSEVTDAE